MKYIRKFENHAAYEAAESGLILPNVSLCVSENEVHYKPYFDPYAGHEYVDLGLPSGTKWAKMNVGASSETDYGLFFQWGDTQGYTADQVGSGEGKKYFGWADYKFNPSGDGSTFTKYNSTDGKTVLDASDDAVAAAWGGNWRMPTEAEFTELWNNTNKQWTTVNGISGYTFTDKTDASKYVFFPAAGYCNSGSMYGVDTYGSCWSSSLGTVSVTDGKSWYFSRPNQYMSSYPRKNGCSVRGVVGQ
jgi:hypothetical protein